MFFIDGSLGSYDTSLPADKFRSEPYHFWTHAGGFLYL